MITQQILNCKPCREEIKTREKRNQIKRPANPSIQAYADVEFYTKHQLRLMTTESKSVITSLSGKETINTANKSLIKKKKPKQPQPTEQIRNSQGK
jgi:hypothetical protein